VEGASSSESQLSNLETANAPDMIVMLPNWENLVQTEATRAANETIVAHELNRLHDEGKPVVSAILMQIARDDMKYMALTLIQRRSTVLGNVRIKQPPRVKLRLVPGVEIPAFDPNGNPVKGRVLMAKVGNVGDNVPPDQAGAIGFSGPIRRQLQAQRNLYRCEEITPEGVTLELADAVGVLRMWGRGIAMRPRRHRSEPTARIQDTWLVEEVPDGEEAYTAPPAPPPSPAPAQPTQTHATKGAR